MHPAGSPILFCGPTQEPVLATAYKGKNWERFWKKCKWRKNSLAVGEACMATFWPTPGFKGRTFWLWVLKEEIPDSKRGMYVPLLQRFVQCTCRKHFTIQHKVYINIKAWTNICRQTNNRRYSIYVHHTHCFRSLLRSKITQIDLSS